MKFFSPNVQLKKRKKIGVRADVSKYLRTYTQRLESKSERLLFASSKEGNDSSGELLCATPSPSVMWFILTTTPPDHESPRDR